MCSLELPVQQNQSLHYIIRSFSENMYMSVHYTGEQPGRLNIFKATVIKPLAHCKCMGNFHSLITFVPSPNEVVFEMHLCGIQRAS